MALSLNCMPKPTKYLLARYTKCQSIFLPKKILVVFLKKSNLMTSKKTIVIGFSHRKFSIEKEKAVIDVEVDVDVVIVVVAEVDVVVVVADVSINVVVVVAAVDVVKVVR